jgi:predicted O-methyltransferase YrrM
LSIYNPRIDGSEEMWIQYCQDKAEAVRYVMERDPKIHIIGEIGIFAGYGAVTMMETAKAEWYYGWDLLSEKSVEIQNANSLLRGKMKRNPWDFRVYHSRDTQSVESLEKENIDLFHVDGDHRPAACYHDMQLAYKAIRNNGWIIVDDYNAALVQDGVDCWVHKHNILHKHFIPGITGNYIIQIGEVYGKSKAA